MKNYVGVKNSWKTSSTAKILVLDHIQKLKGSFKKSNQNLPEVFQDIEKEMLGKLKMRDVEMKRANRSPL
ncbi:MAG: hypothetical protein LW832_03655 [Parachlamydia sp.]|nr:hypothetical protein [Parachlamydia sp.]